MFDPQTVEVQYAQQLWTLSSAVVAFCIVQTLTFAYNFQHSDFRRQIAQARSPLLAIIAGATVGYLATIGGIEWLQLGIVSPLDPKLRDLLLGVAAMKSIVVTLCGSGAWWLCRIAEPDPAP